MLALTKRPQCLNLGCVKPVASSGQRLRPFCSSCHKANYEKTPLPRGVQAFKTGRCQNHDAHQGFPCAVDYTVADWAIGMTEIDHKDGNYLNNTEQNCVELCPMCHKMKGRINGDYMIQNKYIR